VLRASFDPSFFGLGRNNVILSDDDLKNTSSNESVEDPMKVLKFLCKNRSPKRKNEIRTIFADKQDMIVLRPVDYTIPFFLRNDIVEERNQGSACI